MINELAKSRAHTWRGVPHYPVNVCLHCGEEDDPEGYWGEDKDGDRVCRKCEQADAVCSEIDTVLTQLHLCKACQSREAMDNEEFCVSCRARLDKEWRASRTRPMTFERVQQAIKRAFKLAPMGSELEHWYWMAMTEMVIIEREMTEAVTCPRHRPERRFPGGLCQDCSDAMYQAA